MSSPINVNFFKINQNNWLFVILLFVISSCSVDVTTPPDIENEVEQFTYIEFIFTNNNDPSDVTKGIWEDEDGFGPLAPIILQNPVFKANANYTLTFVMENRLLVPFENLLEEIEDEDDEHQLFFEFTNGLFINPSGTGNITNTVGNINYLDVDGNGLPVGLVTQWTTGAAQQNATFRAILGHQPEVKSSTSTWNSGDIDWDITFTINVQN